jgi:hypothetical protein
LGWPGAGCLHCMSPNLARIGRPALHVGCLLFGVKRLWSQMAAESLPDPERSSGRAPSCKRQSNNSPTGALLDHLVGADEQYGRDGEADGICRLEVNGHVVC